VVPLDEVALPCVPLVPVAALPEAADEVDALPVPLAELEVAAGFLPQPTVKSAASAIQVRRDGDGIEHLGRSWFVDRISTSAPFEMATRPCRSPFSRQPFAAPNGGGQFANEWLFDLLRDELR
jgi:hypothetical protein